MLLMGKMLPQLQIIIQRHSHQRTFPSPLIYKLSLITVNKLLFSTYYLLINLLSTPIHNSHLDLLSDSNKLTPIKLELPYQKRNNSGSIDPPT